MSQDWGSDAGPVLRGVDGQWSKKTALARGTSIPVDSMRVLFPLSHAILESIT